MFTNEHAKKQGMIEAVKKTAYERQAYKPDTKMIAKDDQKNIYKL